MDKSSKRLGPDESETTRRIKSSISDTPEIILQHRAKILVEVEAKNYADNETI